RCVVARRRAALLLRERAGVYGILRRRPGRHRAGPFRAQRAAQDIGRRVPRRWTGSGTRPGAHRRGRWPTAPFLDGLGASRGPLGTPLGPMVDHARQALRPRVRESSRLLHSWVTPPRELRARVARPRVTLNCPLVVKHFLTGPLGGSSRTMVWPLDLDPGLGRLIFPTPTKGFPSFDARCLPAGMIVAPATRGTSVPPFLE